MTHKYYGPVPKVSESSFAAMGKPIPLDRCTAALNQVRLMGLTDSKDAWECVGKVANQLERDQPFEALQIAQKYLDLTGAYRLIAALLTA